MKKLILVGFVIFCVSAFGQSNTSGVVRYTCETKITLPRNEENPEIESILPSSHKSNKELLFTLEEALFRNINIKDGSEALHETIDEGRHIVIKMIEPDLVVYSNLKTKTNTEQREFMTRIFLIDFPTDTAKWKMTGNRKKILDYDCLEATLAHSNVVAWFAPSIGVSCGPEGYCGLPGIILELDINNGEKKYNALKLELKDPGEINRPDKGKKVSREEYKAIVEEKKKEMELSGEGNPIIIRKERL